ncbi:AAA family ATPase [Actinomadura welshii]
MLIIDEINRGNLAKIFGELYFLLEYRNEPVNLLYGTEEDQGFTLPRNVIILGTMNTADRSIALVDAAMRRRFWFVELHPDEPPTSEILASWLKAEKLGDEPARLLAELNSRIEDRDFKVGPSYLMRKSVATEAGLARIWRTQILPLLEEHHYGDGTDVPARYGLDALRKHLT